MSSEATDGRLLLVHGAFHRGASWQPLTAELRRRGYAVDAVDLPGRDDPAVAATATLADFVETVVERIHAARGPVILVGHSMGGVTITQAAEIVPDLVGCLVYLAAFVPADGQSLIDIGGHQDFADSLVITSQRFDEERRVSYVPVELGRETFYTDVPETDYGRLGALLVPESPLVAAEPVALTDERWGQIRKVYVETTRDLALPIACQRRMHQAARVDAVHTLDTAHSPFVTAVPALADILAGETNRLATVPHQTPRRA
ncbi:alpha/beta fold hydrolase [Pseudofrankia sp. BMG5.36]|uniref:alpha/beta fold hydrolase n=1 Tax=Pseudofrankia sp. BMG5.36 TaxID=1834512 RepID=UPI0009F61BA4|nr:alpha/beta fold hydrolase [Pseudofrankia sp. BMG5.36]